MFYFMRFEEYLMLSEAADIDKRIDIIKKECNFFLSQVSKNDLLFKAFYDTPSFRRFAPIEASAKESRSLHMNGTVNDDMYYLFDVWFKKVFGLKPHAECVFFCTGNKKEKKNITIIML